MAPDIIERLKPSA